MTHNGNRQTATRKESAGVAAQIAELGHMTIGELRDKYLEVYGDRTRSRNKIYLRKKIAWQVQALAEGGLSQRALDRIEELAPLAPLRWRPNLKDIHVPAPESERRKPKARDPRLPAPGTIITREYKGTEYRVEVLEDGFLYDGQRYGSLSKVAKAITGTHWNGFMFFSLPGKKAGEGN
jgi:hypothetical protein